VASRVETAEAPEDGGLERDGRGRPMRADARRNYDRLIAAAREMFGREGGGVAMEAIAREAGVGVGTLYRHFPKRIDLVEAVYREDVDELVRTGEEVAAALEPYAALQTFLEAFVRYGQTKRRFLTELQEAFEKDPELKPQSRERIEQVMQLVVDRAQRAAVIRTDIDGADIIALIGPMCSNATLTDDQGWRLLTMILDGLRPPN
jgi:AcrR family transcriptional regulator